MSEEKALPFYSFTFTLIADKKPRTAFRMKALGSGLYALHGEKGAAANPSSQFTREVPLEVAQNLKDALYGIGVFDWEESYGDAVAPGTRKWTVNTVFKEGVFSVASKGGSDAPAGFDDMLEELYRLDFPRPAEPKTASMPVIPTSMGDLAAFASKEGLPGIGDLANMDPAVLQQRLKDEFKHMSPEEQNQMIDMLVQSGMGTRDFWERFFRG